jgi:hypothetical protein
MTPSELKTAMKVSRMLDFYYNAPVWQGVIRKLICADADFIRRFTSHLNGIMVLDSPLSIERRGIILYEYCLAHHPDMVVDVSIAWIEAGCSLKKAPAGCITKIKNLEAYLSENTSCMIINYGAASQSHRYYLLTSSDKRILFGYDSEEHHPCPVFRAILSCSEDSVTSIT